MYRYVAAISYSHCSTKCNDHDTHTHTQELDLLTIEKPMLDLQVRYIFAFVHTFTHRQKI